MLRGLFPLLLMSCGGCCTYAQVTWPMLEQGHASKALQLVEVVCAATGKYLNVIRQCGRPVLRPLPPSVHIGKGYCSRRETDCYPPHYG